MGKVKTFEIFTSKYSQVIQAETAGIALNKFAKESDDYNDVIAVLDTERGSQFLTGTSNCNLDGVNARFSKELIDYEIRAKKEAREKEIKEWAQVILIVAVVFAVLVVIVNASL